MTKIKICGLTNIDDAKQAVELGADALGFIFADSPRRITPETTREIIISLPPFVSKVGVFVGEEPRNIQEISDYCHLDFVQLHGEKCWEYCDSISKPLIKAFAVKDRTVLDHIRSRHLQYFMLDTSHAHLHGGTGQTFDWQIAKEASSMGKLILSGGLNPDNIIDALTIVRPYAVDINSGIEESPGVKDFGKMKQFIEEVEIWDSRMH